MRAKKWLCFGVPILVGVGMLLASQPKDKRLPGHRGIDISIPFIIEARRLTTEESTTVATAINNIATPPPSSITYKNAAGNTIAVSCSTLAAKLKAQLNSGRIDVEINSGYCGRVFAAYFMNINEIVLDGALRFPDAGGMTDLEEVLIHEETHKGQGWFLGTNASEVEAHAAELAYKDSIGLDTNIAIYSYTRDEWKRYCNNYDSWQPIKRILKAIWTISGANYPIIYFIVDILDTADMFRSFAQGDTGFYEYDLSPFLRASDMMIHENYPGFPPEHCLALICGGDPFLGHGRILGLDIYEGMVQPPVPHILLDFTVPPYDPMFFYSMARWEEPERYYFVDTLNQQIVTMPDLDGDLIPEMEELSTFASALWPGFEPLMNMRSVEPTIHRYHGFGLIVNHEDAHYTDAIHPYDGRFFLPDADGNNIADACIPVYRYEFLVFVPGIQVPLPIEGDQAVQIVATWEHDIEVWATDELGEILYEQLGMVHMTGGVDAQCVLSRPLVAGEFILPIDMNTGERPWLATKVGGVTIIYNDSTGNVELHFPDTGAPDFYWFIYRSTTSPYDGFTFLGWVPAGVGFYVDYACTNTKAFYYVTGSSSAP